MAEIRENLRFDSLDLESMNRTMGRLQDRLDELEGRRGTPTFYNSLDLQQNRATNASPSENATDVVIKSELDEVSGEQVAPSIIAYTPSKAEIIIGDATGGIVENVQTLLDGNIYVVGEIASTPGFNIHFTFNNVVSFHALVLRCAYDGTSNHTIGVDIYNYVTGNYDQFSLIIDSDVYYQYITIYGINSSAYIKLNSVLTRLYHYSAGNDSHNIYIDYIALMKYLV